MIRTYSEPLIVLEVNPFPEERRTVIVAEDKTYGGKAFEVQVTFTGGMAKEVAVELVPGRKFTYRGCVFTKNGQMLLLGIEYSVIA